MKADPSPGALALCLSLSALGCDHEPLPQDLAPAPDLATPARSLDPALPWHGDNRQRLDALIAQRGAGSAGYDAARRPVATFDWDNTVIRNDIGDATLFWMVKNGKVRQPPQKSWRSTSAYLTTDGAAALSAACAGLGEAGAPLPTGTDAPCGTEILTIYTQGKTSGGKAAFSGWSYRRMEPAYAWAAQLQAGYSAAESRAFAESALQENLAAAQGAKQKIGNVDGLNAWIRIYDQQKDLIGTLQARGWDVWIVSASPQPWVEAAAARVGVAADHVIGIRLVESGGKLTANIQGCGGVPDGTNDGNGAVTGNSLITYIEGKRCWINQVIFGVTGAAALERGADPARRQRFAAGDSDTDITFLQDATDLKLVLNRNKKELMCNAYGNAGGRWLVQPMFIAPLPQQATPYPCASTACKDAGGAGVPCKDEDGAPIPDQQDSVF